MSKIFNYQADLHVSLQMLKNPCLQDDHFVVWEGALQLTVVLLGNLVESSPRQALTIAYDMLLYFRIVTSIGIKCGQKFSVWI